MSAVERHELPNGSVVFYKDADHSYWTGHDERTGKCSGRIPGISTVAKNDGDTNSDNLLNWSARLTCEGVAREASLGLSLDDAEDIHTALGWLQTGESVEAALQAEKLTWRDLRNEKGRTGNVTHGVLEALAQGADPILRTGYDHAVVSWWEEQQPEPLNVEQVVYSQEHGFAGRFDLRAAFDGDTALIDLKTSGFISNAYHVQLAGYELAARECGVGASDERLILQVREDGTWTEWTGHAAPDDFLTALQTYAMGKRISKQARADWRAWKDAEAVAA